VRYLGFECVAFSFVVVCCFSSALCVSCQRASACLSAIRAFISFFQHTTLWCVYLISYSVPFVYIYKFLYKYKHCVAVEREIVYTYTSYEFSFCIYIYINSAWLVFQCAHFSSVTKTPSWPSAHIRG